MRIIYKPIKGSVLDAVNVFVDNTFTGVIRREKQHAGGWYYVPKGAMQRSELFHSLDACKDSLEGTDEAELDAMTQETEAAHIALIPAIPFPPPADHEVFSDGTISHEPLCASRVPFGECTCRVSEIEDKDTQPKIPFHVLPPIQAFTRRMMNEPLTVAFEIYHPGELQGGIRGYSDTVTVSVDSGDPGGGKGEFVDFMQKQLMEWFDGAVVSVKE